MIPASFNGIVFLRLVLCNPLTDDDIKSTLTEIKTAAEAVVTTAETIKSSQNESNSVSLSEENSLPVVKSRNQNNTINMDRKKNNMLGCKLKSNGECSMSNGPQTLHTKAPCFIHPAHS